MRKLILTLILLSFAAFDFAGSSIAELRCVSSSGKTIFNANLQDIDYMLNAEFIIDGEAIRFSNEDVNDKAGIIFDKSTGVFAIYIDGKAGAGYNSKFVKFWSIPSTFKISKSDDGQTKYTFKAKIYGTEPRLGTEHDLVTQEIVLNCTLVYGI